LALHLHGTGGVLLGAGARADRDGDQPLPADAPTLVLDGSPAGEENLLVRRRGLPAAANRRLQKRLVREHPESVPGHLTLGGEFEMVVHGVSTPQCAHAELGHVEQRVAPGGGVERGERPRWELLEDAHPELSTALAAVIRRDTEARVQESLGGRAPSVDQRAVRAVQERLHLRPQGVRDSSHDSGYPGEVCVWTGLWYAYTCQHMHASPRWS